MYQFKVGDKVKSKDEFKKNWYDYFSGEAIFAGESTTRKNASVIKRIDGETGGGQEGLWNINNSDLIYLELVNKHTIMSSITEFFTNLTATPEDKLLKEMGLENPINVPTEEGLKLSALMNYKANRPAIIEVAKQMKAEQDAKK